MSVIPVSSIDEVFQRYGLLGEGGFGVVYYGKDLTTQRMVAAKFLGKLDEASLAHLLSEFKMLDTIKHHAKSQACPVHFACYQKVYLDQSNSSLAGYVLFLDIAPGQRFVDWYNEHQTEVSTETLHQVFEQILQGINVLQQCGLIHADLSFKNIMVDTTTSRPIVTLVDYGEMCTVSGCQVDAENVRSPEQQARLLGDATVSLANVDMFDVGVLLYWCFTKRTPWSKANSFLLSQAPLTWKPTQPCNDEFYPVLSNLCNQLLVADPARRPTAQQSLQWMKSPSVKSVTSLDQTVQTPIIPVTRDSLKTLFDFYGWQDKGTRTSVYYGRDIPGKQDAAAKVFHKLNDADLAHLLYEFQLLDKIKRHASNQQCPLHLVCYRHLYLDQTDPRDPQYVLVMDLASGIPFDEWRNQNPGATEETVAQIFEQIIQGVNVLQQCGIIHGNLTPNNILVNTLGKKPVVTLVGYGRMCAISDYQASEKNVRSPEQQARLLGNSTISLANVDMFDVGVLLYWEIMRHEPWFKGTSFTDMPNPLLWQPTTPIDGEFYPRLSRLCDELLEADPSRRPTAQQSLDWIHSKFFTTNATQLAQISPKPYFKNAKVFVVPAGSYLYRVTHNKWMMENPAQMAQCLLEQNRQGELTLVQVTQTLELPIVTQDTFTAALSWNICFQHKCNIYLFRIEDTNFRTVATWRTDARGKLVNMQQIGEKYWFPLPHDHMTVSNQLLHTVPWEHLPVFSKPPLLNYGAFLTKQVQNIRKIQAGYVSVTEPLHDAQTAWRASH